MKLNKKLVTLLAVLIAVSVPVLAQSITVGDGGTLSGGLMQNNANGMIPTPVAVGDSVMYTAPTIGCPATPTLCTSYQCWATWTYGGVSYMGNMVTMNHYVHGVKSLYVSDCTINVASSG